MMRLKFYSATAGVLFLFLFLYGTGEVHAQGRNIAAEVLCEHAQTFYERGQKQEAIHEFSKVLLIDPQNPTAHDYLARLGVPEGLYRPFKTVTVHRRGGEGDGSSAADQRLSRLENAISTKDRDLSQVRNILVKKDKEIFDLKDTLSRTLQQKQEKPALPAPSEAIQQKDNKDQEDLRRLIKARDEDIAGLKEELALVKKNILPGDLSPSPDLKSQIRSLQLELTEKEMFLKEKEKTLAELKKQLDEITQRNNLSLKIIEEKDSQIKKLVEGK